MPPLHPYTLRICSSFKLRYHLLPNFLVHRQRQRAFPWRGNPCGFSALLSTWHSVHFTAIILSHSTRSATELRGRTFQLIAFKWKLKKIITRLLCQNDSCYAAFGVGNWRRIPFNVPFTMPPALFFQIKTFSLNMLGTESWHSTPHDSSDSQKPRC